MIFDKLWCIIIKRGDKMQYELLSKCFYKLTRNQYETECIIRKKSISTVSLPITVNNNESFYLCTNEMMILQESIYKNNLELTEKIDRLPGIALAFCIKKCLIDEVNTTNDIEGVYSTRKELDEIYENIHPQAGKNKFKGLVDKYKLLIEQSSNFSLNSCEDIRTLYDDIISAEIEPDEQPDGKIFRKGSVSVSNGIKDVHTGVMGENNIIEYMNRVISIMQDTQIPIIVRTALCHYYIGYIHPFYNGNGRLSRFIASYMLRSEMNILLSYRLAYTIHQNKRKYYKSFDICNDVRNYGDVTHFVLMFCEIINESLLNLHSIIDNSIDRINFYFCQLEKIFNDNEQNEKKIFAILIQNSLFENIGLSIPSLSYYSEMSVSTVRNTIKKLKNKLNNGSIILETHRQSHSNVYSVNMERLDEFLNQQNYR